MSIKVIATRMGYYDHKRRKEGSVFTIKSEKDFSKNWMEIADGTKIKSKKRKPQIRTPQPASKGAKALHEGDAPNVGLTGNKSNIEFSKDEENINTNSQPEVSDAPDIDEDFGNDVDDNEEEKKDPTSGDPTGNQEVI